MFIYLNTAVPTCGLEALLSSDTHSPSLFLLEFVFIRRLARRLPMAVSGSFLLQLHCGKVTAHSLSQLLVPASLLELLIQPWRKKTAACECST